MNLTKAPPARVAPDRGTTLGLRGAVRRFVGRRHVDGALDWARFRVDTFPRDIRLLARTGLPELQSAVYHDLPWVGLRGGRRSVGTLSRWRRMEPLIREHGARTALDVGASTGWFSFALADLGVPTIAVERERRALRIVNYARERKPGAAERIGCLLLDVTPDSVGLLPEADAVVFLSTWHHLVNDFGVDGATRALAALWSKTRAVLFFETGEAEVPASWGLPPMEPTPHDWLTVYLARSCPGGRIVTLGRHAALGPDNEDCSRSLFAVVREPGQR